MGWYNKYKQRKASKKGSMKNYCLYHGILKDFGFGVCQKMKKKTFVVCYYSLNSSQVNISTFEQFGIFGSESIETVWSI